MKVTHPLQDDQALEVAGRARLCDLAVNTRFGPHVTPEIFAVAGRRIWVVTSCKSVKVRSIRRAPEVAVLLRSVTRSLALAGRAEVLSPWSPAKALRLIPLAPVLAEALTRYAVRNVPTLAGYALDMCRLPAGALPLDRVLVEITPNAGLLTDAGEIIRAWGHVPDADRAQPAAEHFGPPTDVRMIAPRLPVEVASLFTDERDCAVAFSTEHGPVVVGGSWDPERHRADVPYATAKAAGMPSGGDSCVMLDDPALRPTQLRGVMLRGPGRTLRHKANAAVELRLRRATWWNGFETGTVLAPAEQLARGGRAG